MTDDTGAPASGRESNAFSGEAPDVVASDSADERQSRSNRALISSASGASPVG